MSFKIGQRVRIIDSNVPPRIGVITEVLSGPVVWDGMIHYEVDVPPTTWQGARFSNFIQAQWLVPVDDDDDDASWERIEKMTGWNPNRVTA